MVSSTPRHQRVHAEDSDGSERKRPEPTGVYCVGTVSSLSRQPCLKCKDDNALHRLGRCVTCGTVAKVAKSRIVDDWF
jgi:hypothetical protein